MILTKNNGIFKSIQGEGALAGTPTVFVRTFGCNQKCTFCDQKESWGSESNSVNISVEDIAKKVESTGYDELCITGGEPMLQADEVRMLCRRLYPDTNISIETNMSVYDPIPMIFMYSFSPKLHFWPEDQFIKWMEYCYINAIPHQVKVVCRNEIDVADAISKVGDYNKCLMIQPMYGNSNMKELVECCINYNIRLSLQTHKYVGIL